MRHGAKNFPHILGHFYGSPWAIQPNKLAELHKVLWMRLEKGGEEIVQLEQISKDQRAALNLPSSSRPMAASPSDREEENSGYQLVGSVAVIRINGVISSRSSIFDDWSGGTSHDAIARATANALESGKVESIVYDVDSPGGTVFGQIESATKVFDAKKTKPTTAVANHIAASAAYWYLSQAAEAVVTPSGQVGCIGVIVRTVDETEALKMAGVRDVLVSNAGSPYKTEGYPQIPFTEEHRAEMQRSAEKYAGAFVNAIARGRGIRPATVEKNFGQGRMVLAEDALAANMVDRIATLQDVVDGANNVKSRRAKRQIAAQMVAMGLPTQRRE